MTPFLLLIACIVGAASGTTYFTTFNTDNHFSLGGHKISLATEPIPKLYVDDDPVDLTSAGTVRDGVDYILYSDFPNLPGFSLKLYNNGGYAVYHEENGIVTKYGTLSEEDQRQLNQHIQTTFENTNRQLAQFQHQMSNIMRSMSGIFHQPAWPFFGWPFLG